MPTQDRKEEMDYLFIWFAIGTTILVLGLWCFTYFTLIYVGEQTLGTFGDMFGGVNALFSRFAFGGIILTKKQNNGPISQYQIRN